MQGARGLTAVVLISIKEGNKPQEFKRTVLGGSAQWADNSAVGLAKWWALLPNGQVVKVDPMRWALLPADECGRFVVQTSYGECRCNELWRVPSYDKLRRVTQPRGVGKSARRQAVTSCGGLPDPAGWAPLPSDELHDPTNVGSRQRRKWVRLNGREMRPCEVGDPTRVG